MLTALGSKEAEMKIIGCDLHAAQQTIVYGEDVDPDAAIARLDEVTFDQVAEIAASVPDALSVACVGPNTEEELASA